MITDRIKTLYHESKLLRRNRSDPPPRPSPTRGEGVIAKQLLSVFPLPWWEGARGRGLNAYVAAVSNRRNSALFIPALKDGAFRAILVTRLVPLAASMNIPSHLLPSDWLFFADVVGAVVLWQAIRYAPWRQLRAAGLQQLFSGSVVALLLLWSLGAGLKPGLGFHFLGVTVFTLMFGWSMGVLGVGLATLGLALKGGGLEAVALNALLFGALPVSVSYLVYQWVDRHLPHHIFIYIYLCAFLGAMLAAGCAVLAMVGLLVANNVYSFDEMVQSYLPFLPLFLFPEGVLNGMLITVFIGIRPHWLKTFDDESYFNR